MSFGVVQAGVHIKPEPEEQRLAPLSRSGSWQAAQPPADVKPRIKPEPVDPTRFVSFCVFCAVMYACLTSPARRIVSGHGKACSGASSQT